MLQLIAAILMAWFFASPALAAQTGRALKVENCHVGLIRDIEIAADESGLITQLFVKSETTVEKGTVLAQIDDRHVKIQKAAAQAAFEAAEIEAKNEINKKFAQASYDVANATLKMSEDANFMYDGAVVKAEIEKLKLDVIRSKFQIEQATIERRVAEKTAAQKQAEVDAASLSLDRRRVKSPFAGLVAKIEREQFEWVKEGEPILRLIQMDRVKVKGDFNPSEFLPQQLRGKPVLVTVNIAGQNFEFEGVVTEIGATVKAGYCPFFAEVENRMQDQEWLLRDGLAVSMSVNLDAPAQETRTTVLSPPAKKTR